MSFYNLLDTMISKLNKSIKIEEQNLNVSEKAQARSNINAASKNDVYKRNLLDNSDFSNPVNQREQTSYTAAATNNNAHAIDRWEVFRGTVTINSGYVNFTSEQTANYKRFVQLVGTKFEVGKTYTLALLARVNSVSGWVVLRLAKRYSGSGGTQIKNTTTGFEWITYTYTLTEDIETPGFDILVSSTASDYLNIDIKAAAIYEGSYTAETLPEYQPKGYAAELAECQRYYREYWDDGIYVYCYSSGYLAGFEFEKPMRVAPSVQSISVLNLTDFSSLSANSSNAHATTANGVTYFNVPNTQAGTWYRITRLVLDSNL